MKAIEPLVGLTCDQVWFSRERTELWFDGEWALYCITPPVVQIGSSIHVFPEPGARDALCSLINCGVQSATFDSRRHVEIRFTNEAVLTVDADPSNIDAEAWWVGQRGHRRYPD
jgi:hypothetical protein